MVVAVVGAGQAVRGQAVRHELIRRSRDGKCSKHSAGALLRRRAVLPNRTG